MLNYPTLLLVLVGFTTLTTVLLVAVALSSDALAEQRLWAVGNVANCLGFAIGTSTALPDVVHGGVSYGFMGLGLALVLRGLRRFCGRDLSWRWLAGISLLAFLLPAYFAQVHPDLTARLIVTGIYLGLLNLVCAITLLRGLRGSIRATMWISAGGFSVLGLALILRAAYLLVTPAGSNNAQTVETVMGVTILIVALAQVTIAFGLIMLVSHRYVEKLNRLTLIDGLTGALNRVGMERMGQRVLTRSRQSHRSVSVVMVDADYFKVINDTYGHPVGDQVLIHLASMLTAQVRPGDLVIRYGGEEFVLMLDGSSLETAVRVADRLRGLIEDSHVSTESGDIRYQVSIGVSCTDKTGYSLNQLLIDADAALYRAKQEGRNRVCV
jgi:diguanylate cyclase (GGDEF)-like protein